MTHLFKLKKDGKTVGYEQHALLTPDNYIVILHSKHCRWSALGCYNIKIYPDKFIIHNEKRPFVCKDKNGKDVFADDPVWFHWMGKKVKAKVTKDDLFHHLISATGKEEKGLPRTLCKGDLSHIELMSGEKE